MDLTDSLEKIKGVGKANAEHFARAEIFTIEDLINFLPRTYEDYSKIIKIADMKPGKATIKAHVEKISTRPFRRGLRVTTATLVDDTGKVQAVWFNQPYRVRQLDNGKEFFFSGEFEFSYNRFQLKSPSAELVSEAPTQTDRILPIYRSIYGLKSALVRKVLSELRPLIAHLPETLPREVVQSEKLLSRAEAVQIVHFPTDVKSVEKARERLAFEELFQLMLASQLNKQANTKLSSWQVPFNQELAVKFVKNLPFQLTDSQRRAAWDILQDLEKSIPMNRMLQGDVGSGKTVVAGLAAAQASLAGFQTALMAPTEILASQHADTLDGLLRASGVKVGLLTGRVTGSKRANLYKQIAAGEIDVIVGTQALLQSKVTFNKLGLVIIDEQHRFGVEQRQKLLKKSEKMPHLLTMTATPIPRSLALTAYGELDISTLNELPRGRKPIITKIWSPNSRDQLYQQIDEVISAGSQVYIICSLIEDGLQDEAKSVQKEYVRLQNSIFKHRRIGLLHGKMKSSEKDEVMTKFANGDFDILVSTTVVEVGIDVPNASVIVIEDADRFGLSQLHQLRGRVGRGSKQSYCYLVTSSSARPSQRLKAIEKSNDGFYLAEVDLKLRGPGEIYGKMQHGQLNLQIATLADTRLLARVQKQAKEFVKSGNNLLQYKELAKQIQRYQKITTLN